MKATIALVTVFSAAWPTGALRLPPLITRRHVLQATTSALTALPLAAEAANITKKAASLRVADSTKFAKTKGQQRVAVTEKDRQQARSTAKQAPLPTAKKPNSIQEVQAAVTLPRLSSTYTVPAALVAGTLLIRSQRRPVAPTARASPSRAPSSTPRRAPPRRRLPQKKTVVVAARSAHSAPRRSTQRKSSRSTAPKRATIAKKRAAPNPYAGRQATSTTSGGGELPLTAAASAAALFLGSRLFAPPPPPSFDGFSAVTVVGLGACGVLVADALVSGSAGTEVAENEEEGIGEEESPQNEASPTAAAPPPTSPPSKPPPTFDVVAATAPPRDTLTDAAPPPAVKKAPKAARSPPPARKSKLGLPIRFGDDGMPIVELPRTRSSPPLPAPQLEPTTRLARVRRLLRRLRRKRDAEE
jgi:hypothetical protein